MLSALQAYLRTAAAAARETEVVGPFLATFTPGSTSPFRNYAIPEEGAAPSPEEVEALVGAFARRGLLPRLEYLDVLAPEVEAALRAGGFAPPEVLAAMTCEAVASGVAVPGGIVVEAPRSAADRRALLVVQHAAFGDEPPSEADLARAEAGGPLAVVARDVASSEVVGGGTGSEPARFTELGGIAVAPSHRRRGIATAVTAELTRRAFAAGVETAYLTPADDGAAEAYLRAGYAKVGRMLHISRA